MGLRQLVGHFHLNTRHTFLSKVNLSFSPKLSGLIVKLLFVIGFEISFPLCGCFALLIKFTARPFDLNSEINLLLMGLLKLSL